MSNRPDLWSVAIVPVDMTITAVHRIPTNVMFWLIAAEDISTVSECTRNWVIDHGNVATFPDM